MNQATLASSASGSRSDSGVTNQNITSTIRVEGVLADSATMGTWQADYQLTALEFEYIENGKPVTFNFANSILLTTFGYGFSLAPKMLSKLSKDTSGVTISDGEWITLAIGAGLVVLLYAIGLLMPNNRKKVMKKIRNHFEVSPKKRHMYRGE